MTAQRPHKCPEAASADPGNDSATAAVGTRSGGHRVGRVAAARRAALEALTTGRTVVYVSRGEDGQPVVEHLTPDDARQLAARWLDEVHVVYENLAAAIRPALEDTAATVRRLYEGLVQARAVPAQPPDDPMARALHLRRHRNTGPEVHGDARRNRGRR